MNQRFMRAITFFVGISLLLTNLGLVGTIPVMAMANSSPAAPERTQQQEPSDTPPVPAVEPSSTPQPVDTAVVEPVATTEVPVVIPNAAIASPADVATLPDVKICIISNIRGRSSSSPALKMKSRSEPVYA